jgi:hypothetical protein
MQYLFSLLLVLAYLSQSCSNKEFETEFAEIDKLTEWVDSAEIYIEAIDSAPVMISYQKYGKHIKTIQKLYAPDTVDTLFARQLMMYKTIKGAGKSLTSDLYKYRNEILFSRKNLKALKENIQAGTFPEDSVKSYLADEQKAIKNLLEGTRFMKKYSEMALDNFRKYNPFIEERVQLLQQIADSTKQSE